ncbi:DNA ligase [Bradyrhizobium nanningense]|uniref:ATP-dependent DNA ligase n=1 Tax=Bradyrhizobium nanningense TaxID=1325118 RepID=UPI003221735B
MAKTVPSGPDYIRDHDRVRLITRGGHDWSKRFPWIVEAALKNRTQQFVIDGEAVVLGVDGVSDFNALHSRKHDHEVQLYTFDVLAMGGDDLRDLPLHLRKTELDRLLARCADGIFVAPFETGDIAPISFRPPAGWGWRGGSPSTGTSRTVEGGRSTGSR